MNTVKGIAASRGIKPENAIEKFFTDIEKTSDLKSGFENNLSALKQEIEKIKSKLNQYQTRLEQLKEEHAELTEAITTIQQLKKKRVKPTNIITWNTILTKSKVKPEELARALEQCSSLENLIQERSRELTKLETKIRETEVKLSELEKEKQALEAAVKENLKKFQEKLEQASQSSIKNTQAAALSALTKIKESAEESHQALISTRNTLKADLEQVQKDLKNLEKEIELLAEKSIEIGEKIGKFEAIKPLLEFIWTGKGEPNTVIPCMLSLLEQFRAWLKHSRPSSLPYMSESWLNSLINDLKEALSHGLT
ncbi:hypothetical protein DRO64_04940 [Candidatus Bathyarchaeota archaeon]|nr:MAG: hypothetical protein DRO64_04940 [Candidatus Bathyarchaeota archaeon]